MIHYFRGVRKENKVFYIYFDPDELIICSNGYSREHNINKWHKANGDIPGYLMSILALVEKPIQVEERDYLVDCEKYPTTPNKSLKALHSVPDEKTSWFKNLKQELALDELQAVVTNLICQKNLLSTELEKLKAQKTPKTIVFFKAIPQDRATLFVEKKTFEEVDYNKLKTKLHLTESELRKSLKEKSKLGKENTDLKRKLENAQKFIKSFQLSKRNESGFQSKETQVREDLPFRLGDKLDGAYGFHERREDGRFGSLSSFDNYGDDYNEKDDPQVDNLL